MKRAVNKAHIFLLVILNVQNLLFFKVDVKVLTDIIFIKQARKLIKNA